MCTKLIYSSNFPGTNLVPDLGGVDGEVFELGSVSSFQPKYFTGWHKIHNPIKPDWL